MFVVWGKGFKTTHFPLTLCFIKANESVISHEIYMAKTNMVRLIVKAWFPLVFYGSLRRDPLEQRGNCTTSFWPQLHRVGRNVVQWFDVLPFSWGLALRFMSQTGYLANNCQCHVNAGVFGVVNPQEPRLKLSFSKTVHIIMLHMCNVWRIFLIRRLHIFIMMILQWWYHLVIWLSYGQSLINRGFNGKIICKWTIFHSYVQYPEGNDVSITVTILLSFP